MSTRTTLTERPCTKSVVDGGVVPLGLPQQRTEVRAVYPVSGAESLSLTMRGQAVGVTGVV